MPQPPQLARLPFRCGSFVFLLMLASAVLLGGAVAAHGGEVIDRIVATVNDRIILQSDWELAVRCEAFLQAKPLESLTAEDQNATLQRLIDQELLRQQMGKTVAPPSDDQLATRMRRVRAATPGAQTDDGWHAALAAYGLTEAEVAERIAVQMQILGMVEGRMRPGIRIDAAAIQAYYQNTLLPELRKSGVAAEPRLDEVTGRIREILVQQHIDDELSSLLRALRQEANIRLRPLSPPPTPPDAERTWRTPSGSGVGRALQLGPGAGR